MLRFWKTPFRWKTRFVNEHVYITPTVNKYFEINLPHVQVHFRTSCFRHVMVSIMQICYLKNKYHHIRPTFYFSEQIMWQLDQMFIDFKYFNKFVSEKFHKNALREMYILFQTLVALKWWIPTRNKLCNIFFLILLNKIVLYNVVLKEECIKYFFIATTILLTTIDSNQTFYFYFQCVKFNLNWR